MKRYEVKEGRRFTCRLCVALSGESNHCDLCPYLCEGARYNVQGWYMNIRDRLPFYRINQQIWFQLYTHM